MIFYLLFVIYLYLLPLAAWAALTSNEPCHNGQCQWDISTNTGSGSLQIVSALHFMNSVGRSFRYVFVGWLAVEHFRPDRGRWMDCP